MTGERQKKSSKNGVSSLRKAELEKFANNLKNKKQYGGVHTPDHLSEISGINESWNLGKLLGAPVNLGPPRQVQANDQTGGKSKKKSKLLKGGGEESSGATFLPPQWNNATVPLANPNNPSEIESAYGKINAVNIGCDVNLAAFPGSSMQQTGGAPKKGKKTKTTKKKDTSTEKPAKKGKKGKKGSKKELSLWEQIKAIF
jgi:hypothetical protein